MLTRAFFDRTTSEIARDLIGVTLLVEGIGGIIVETEAYEESEPASHSFGGRTVRNGAMFGPAGLAYVYRSYGLHWCLNVGCGPEHHGNGVLLRALAPTEGIDIMRERRGTAELSRLCSGPGRLTAALAVTRDHDGLAIDVPPFRLLERAGDPPIAIGPRIGISKAVDRLWRFGWAGSPWLSRRFPGQAPARGQS